LDTLIQDLRYAVRGLVRSPGFTIAVVLTLALGIGANTTMFGVLDALLLRAPAHVTDPSRVQRIYFRRDMMGRSRTGSGTSFPAYESFAGVRDFSAVAAVAGGSVSIGSGTAARQAQVQAVSASLFPLLGVQPEKGRFFDSTDDQLGAGPVLVVSHTYWQRELNGDPDVLHRTIQIGQFVYSIVGVAPVGFTGADLDEPDFWLPIRQSAPLLAGAEALGSRNFFWLSVLARLAPGVTPAAATAEAQIVFDRGEAASRGMLTGGGPGTAPAPGGRGPGGPGGGAGGPGAGVRRPAGAAAGPQAGPAAAPRRPPNLATTVLLGPIQKARGPDMSSDAKVALWVGLVALAVLLVACANAGNLLLARGLRRRTELAVRAGLGAGRGRLVRQLLVESVVLALLGGAAGLFVALWGGSVVRAYLLPKAAVAGSLLDPRILLFTFAVSLVAGALAGSAPAWQSSHTDLAGSLKTGGRDVSGGRGVLRSSLLTIQVALTLVLLVGAGLFVRSLRHAETLDYGLDLSRILVAHVNLHAGGVGQMSVSRTDIGGGQVATDPQSAAYLRLLDRIRANPAVENAAVTVSPPFQSAIILSLGVSGRDSLPRVAGGGPYATAVSPTYFATAGTPIVRGRGLTDADVQGAAPVAVVGQSLARFAWPNADPIGQCLYLDPGRKTCVQVVGVAADVRTMGVSESTTLVYYLPYAEHLLPMPLSGLLVRTRGPARAAAGAVQHALQTAEPDLPFVSVRSMLDAVEPGWRAWQLGATMLSVFGVLALAIASLGLYGVTAYGVTQRTREIGVRIALGAGDGSVVRLAVGQALRATAVGGVIGLVIALGLARAVASLLFGVKPVDPVSLGGALGVLLAVAAVAAWVPARRAARVDPMEALRTE
jgi:putative ABC transport system permease protein